MGARSKKALAEIDPLGEAAARSVPSPAVKVLLVEDDDSDAFLVQDALDGVCPGAFDVSHMASLEASLPQVDAFAIMLLDFSLPGISGLEALAKVRAAAPRMPVVVLTGYDDEHLAMRAMQHGAQDYLVKERFDGAAIKRALTYSIERKNFEQALSQMANTDLLTGLMSRNFFEQCLRMAMARIRRSGAQLAVCFLDLDGFKAINDRLGHAAADALLKESAKRLRGCLRESDAIARFGGDEFAMLLEGVSTPRDCAIIARKMIDTLAEPFLLPEGEVTVGVSIGIAFGKPHESENQLLRHADAAMYRAKVKLGSNFQFYTALMDRQTSDRIQLEQELIDAMGKDGELLLYYQPKLDIETGELVGTEALIRWDHPKRGLLAPASFIPLISGTSAAEALDAWVMETVCRDMRCWQAAGMKPVQVSMHLSDRQ